MSWDTFRQVLIDARLLAVVQACGVLFLAWFVARQLKRRIPALYQGHQGLLVRRAISLVIYTIAILWVLRILGVDLTVLLGAAGVLTVALGFASQTSASNVISGIFLMVERPFVIGDIIQVETTTGEVLSIDLMSVRLRTFDNLLVRLPNETMLKSKVSNLTHFPIRRADLMIGVAYKENIGRVRDLLLEVTRDHPLCLEEPQPMFLFTGYGASAVEFQFSFWITRANFLQVRTEMYERIKEAFDEAGIVIPFPHRSLHMAPEGRPLKVMVVPDATPSPTDANSGNAS